MLAKLSRSPSMSSLRSSERGLKFYLNYYGKKNLLSLRSSERGLKWRYSKEK